MFEGSSTKDNIRITFNDKEAECRDAFTKERGWDIFYSFYGNRDKPIPMSNPWTLNLGNLVVQNVFVEPMLIRELVVSYDSPSKTVRSVDGYVLLDISHRAIVECFGLDKASLKEFNRKNMERSYQYKKNRYRKDFVPHYMRKLFKISQNYVLASEMQPFILECFEPYFVKTYYALGQVLGVYCGLTHMPINFMMITINIQHPIFCHFLCLLG